MRWQIRFKFTALSPFPNPCPQKLWTTVQGAFHGTSLHPPLGRRAAALGIGLPPVCHGIAFCTWRQSQTALRCCREKARFGGAGRQRHGLLHCAARQAAWNRLCAVQVWGAGCFFCRSENMTGSLRWPKGRFAVQPAGRRKRLGCRRRRWFLVHRSLARARALTQQTALERMCRCSQA